MPPNGKVLFIFKFSQKKLSASTNQITVFIVCYFPMCYNMEHTAQWGLFSSIVKNGLTSPWRLSWRRLYDACSLGAVGQSRRDMRTISRQVPIRTVTGKRVLQWSRHLSASCLPSLGRPTAMCADTHTFMPGTLPPRRGAHWACCRQTTSHRVSTVKQHSDWFQGLPQIIYSFGAE